jgi:isochorismate synthase
VDRFYWNHPATGTRLVARGVVHAIEASGEDRFAELSRGCGALWEQLVVVGDAGPIDCGPLLLGGFGFTNAAPAGAWSGFPAARLVLPQVLLIERRGQQWLTVSFAAGDPRQELEELRPVLASLFEPDEPRRSGGSGARSSVNGECGGDPGPEYRVQSDRSHGRYRQQVEMALGDIVDGDLEKVVLARSLRVRHDGRFDLTGLLDRLAGIYPDCVTFAVGRAAERGTGRPGACFLGATPELLASRSGVGVRTSAMAGTAPRGRTPEADARLGRELRECKKEQEEHAVVVRAIREALDPLCSRMSLPESPHLVRLEGIQHLHTPIEGVLKQTDPLPSVVDLAARLHPTPAVAGTPLKAAIDWIHRCEGMDRGWYTGGVGFIDSEGGGELRVALRSCLVRAERDRAEALLFAGGGIVAGSRPDRELEETRIKLRALLAPLTEI